MVGAIIQTSSKEWLAQQTDLVKKMGQRFTRGSFILLMMFFAASNALGQEGALRAKANIDKGERPPNVIYIMADDLGYGDLGSYGQEKIKTPHLDRMAREGTRFTQFYSGHTVCAPSRYALFTGRHTGHTLVRGNLGIEPRGDVPLQPEDTTLAEVFKAADYQAGLFGKWALGLKGTTGAPHRQGFDAFLGYEDQSEAHHYYVDRLQGIEHSVTVNVDVDTTQYTHDLLAEAALNFIGEHEAEPFFLYLPFTIPHKDLIVPKEALDPYLDEQGNSLFQEPDEPVEGNPHPNATYAAMVSRLDRDVGRILKRLEALGLAENTIVFFTSDNGPHEEGGHDPEVTNSNGPLRGIKRDLYEGGVRVPMIAWGPGTVPAGRVSDHVWAAWDVLPTLAELIGPEAPSGIDGLSMASAVTGRGEPPEHEYLYWEFHGGTPVEAVRAGRWKALRKPMLTGEIELYDLETDPGEQNNVADQHPRVVRRMHRMLAKARTQPRMEEFQVTGNE